MESNTRDPMGLLIEKEEKKLRRYSLKIGYLSVDGNNVVYVSDGHERKATFDYTPIKEKLVSKMEEAYNVLKRSEREVERTIGAPLDDVRHASLDTLINEGSYLVSYLEQMVHELSCERCDTIDRDYETLRIKVYLFEKKLGDFSARRRINVYREYLTPIDPRM